LTFFRSVFPGFFLQIVQSWSSEVGDMLASLRNNQALSTSCKWRLDFAQKGGSRLGPTTDRPVHFFSSFFIPLIRR
jgi:hypothetical protein